MPPQAPVVSGLDLGVCFDSATDIARIGGDFYDVIDRGAAGCVLFVGDYSGHGIEAAGMAARARYAMAGAARQRRQPWGASGRSQRPTRRAAAGGPLRVGRGLHDRPRSDACPCGAGRSPCAAPTAGRFGHRDRRPPQHSTRSLARRTLRRSRDHPRAERHPDLDHRRGDRLPQGRPAVRSRGHPRGVAGGRTIPPTCRRSPAPSAKQAARITTTRSLQTTDWHWRSDRTGEVPSERPSHGRGSAHDAVAFRPVIECLTQRNKGDAVSKQYRVAVVGATGAVGHEMRAILAQRRFPISELLPLASARSAGIELEFGTECVECGVLGADSFRDVDLALFSAGATVSRDYAPDRPRRRMRRHRQLVRMAHGPGRALDRAGGEPGRTPRGTGGSSPTRTARRSRWWPR